MARVYRMVLSTGWYDEETRRPTTYEFYEKVARRGEIRKVRRTLAKRGLKHFQKLIYRWTKHWPPRHRVRISFEAEQPATKTDKFIQIEVLRMERKNNRWVASRLPSRILSYFKRRRRR